MSKSGSVRLDKETDDLLEQVKKQTSVPKKSAIKQAVWAMWGAHRKKK